MAVKRFEVGDRVRTRTIIHGVSRGTSGTIQQVLGWGGELYDMQSRKAELP
jgi:hypothetical protein